MQPRTLLLIALLPAFSWGCHTLSSPMKSSTSARENPYAGDPWIEDAGTIARTEHNPEPINDPLGLRNFFMSEKARDIERNLGVGD